MLSILNTSETITIEIITGRSKGRDRRERPDSKGVTLPRVAGSVLAICPVLMGEKANGPDSKKPPLLSGPVESLK